MEKAFVAINLPNLVSIAIMAAVLYAAYRAAQKLGFLPKAG